MQFMDVWKFLAGLGFFLFGMSQLESILKSISGRSLKLFLKRNTQNLFKAIVGGAFVTGIVQSSTVVSLIILAFVEAGVIKFRNALGIILGTNLGTTLTGWIIAVVGFNIDVLKYSLPVIAIASIGIFIFEKRQTLRNLFALFFALGVLFLGLGYMKEGALAAVKDFDVQAYSGYGTYVFVLIGFLLTSIIQSSSATVAITLTAVYAGLLNFPSALSMVIGAEVGTTLTILLWGMKGSSDKKRVAWGNFIFNAFTATIAYSFLQQFIYFIENIVHIKNPLIGIAFFQTVINAIAVMLFIPFLKPFAKWLEKKIVDKDSSTNTYASHDLPLLPLLATDAMRIETEKLLRKTLQYIKTILCAENKINEGWIENFKSLTHPFIGTDQEYQRLKKTEGDLLVYYSYIQENKLSKEETTILLHYVNAIRQCIYASKAIKDVEHNIKEFEASVNDTLHLQCIAICNEWNQFDNHLNQLFINSDKSKLPLEVNIVMDKVFNQDKKIKIEIIRDLKNNLLNELEASTILNVYREMLSCKKSLLAAVESVSKNGKNEF